MSDATSQQAEQSPRSIRGFELLWKISEDGMGTVYRAQEISPNRMVALRILSPRLAANPSYIEVFRSEARSAARLRHPNIVSVYGAGESDGAFFYATELVEGRSLSQWVQQFGALPEKTVVEIGLCVASALKYAWDTGRLIHRDVRPENITVDNQGGVKLGELGLAKVFDRKSFGVPGEVFGSPHYVSPEHVRGDRPLDLRSDIYSLGLTLYFAVTGQVPFAGDADRVVMGKQLVEQLADPREFAPGTSARFCAVLEKMLAKDPAERYQDWGEVFNDLEQVRQGNPPRCNPPNTKSTMRFNVTAPKQRGSRRIPLALVVAAIAATVLAIGVNAAVYFLRPRPRPITVAPKPTVPPRSFVNSIGMEFVLVPAGEFDMGSDDGEPDERPVHRVRFTRPFYISKYEVTQEQYEAVMGSNPSSVKGGRLPVDNVTWFEAMQFCRLLTAKERKTYRLPTEAEWEYACRANTLTDYYTGDGEETLAVAGWYWGNSSGKMQLVGQKEPNLFGLYDMHGNVSEWCGDWYDQKFYSQSPETNPYGAANGELRVARGGSYRDAAGDCRAARRLKFLPSFRHEGVGFRVVMMDL